ncbi:hypothetical protein [Streptomyces sp. NPDC058739]|uniref:hypothetical protein n=1 Tax=Streptomyces sp. NPDC058739 TaxID=3346618 RepID=UPI0036BED1C1
MGSLRNPVGPLPSSIYWRRRVVLVSMVALLALLATWVVASGGGGRKDAQGTNGKNPAPSTITPGPSGSGPAISQAPGGRDESGDGGSDGSGSGSGSGSGGDTGSGTGGDSDGANGSGAGGSDGGDGSGAGGSGSAGGAVDSGGGSVSALPASSSLPNCTSDAVTLTLRSLHNSYSPDQTPSFQITAKNSSGSDCKVDLGPKGAVLTITRTNEDDPYWSSADCPEGAAGRLYRVPAGSSITYTVEWDRRPSAAECGTPPAGAAGAGTYLVEARSAGFAKAQTSFLLKAD